MRTAIVTGGTYGIGRAITLELARRDYCVVALGLESRQLSSLAEGGGAALRKEMAEERLQGDVLEADVASAVAVQGAVEHTVQKFGSLDCLVNNAAIGPLGNVLETSEEVWDRVLAVNLQGAFLMSRAAIPFMIRAGGGAIVNVGSGAGWGKPNMAAYSASKGGLFALTAALAYDHFHDHIRVNAVIPGGGGITTGMSMGRVEGDPARLGRHAAGTVAGRSATPTDIARAVAFLLSEESEVISGAILDVGCFFHQGGPVPARPS